MDGQMARTYKMVSRFGDVYDHTTDMIVDVLLFSIVWYKYRNTMPVWCIILLVVFILMLATAMGCQQVNYTDDSKRDELLDVNIKMCPSPSSIVWTRFFGAGTWQIFLTLLVVFLYLNEAKQSVTTPLQGGLPTNPVAK
jgi:phosphatidylglycerophosphate synthase